MSIELDFADCLRRMKLLQAELDSLNALADMHNERIGVLHRDLHEAAALIGDIHVAGGELTPTHLHRIATHVAKHGHPQDVPEYHEPTEA